MSLVVVLDAGHGLPDPGAVGYVSEYQIAFRIMLKVKALLEGQGVKVILTRTSDKSLSTLSDVSDNKRDDLNKRVNIINNSGCDFGVSFHLNAGGGTGYETVCYNASNSKVLKFHEVVSAFYESKGFKDRGLKATSSTHTGGVAIIDRTTPVVVLGEHLFVDTKNDADHIGNDAFQSELALAVTKAILQANGKSYVAPTTTTAPTDSSADVTLVIVKDNADGWLWTYNSANWDDKAIKVTPGEAFTVVGEVTVGSGKMYKLKSGLYITASPTYVEVR